jgi:ABC-2 type transport system permease protein
MTFVNLIGVQESRLGHAGVDVHAFGATAACKRLGPGRDATGGGNWTCMVNWSVPGRKGSLHDTYDLSVTADGCFTATADSAEAHVGGPSLTTHDGRTLPNLLYVFDGCFDTT